MIEFAGRGAVWIDFHRWGFGPFHPVGGRAERNLSKQSGVFVERKRGRKEQACPGGGCGWGVGGEFVSKFIL